MTARIWYKCKNCNGFVDTATKFDKSLEVMPCCYTSNVRLATKAEREEFDLDRIATGEVK
jgi:hypothetical protein